MLSGEPPAKRPRAGAAEVPAMKNPKFYRLRAHANPLAESFALREEAPASPSCVDWAALFPAIRQNPSRKVAWVDVGCGFGGLVASLAEHYPSEIVLGMEIRDKVSAAAQERIVEQQQQQQQQMLLGNAAVIRANCMRCLPQYLYKGQLDKLSFCFPDPHFQQTNHRRRIISAGLLAQVSKGGSAVIPTDGI
jgi:tRNA (guanine-N7-)-methyltransferase